MVTYNKKPLFFHIFAQNYKKTEWKNTLFLHENTDR